MISDVLTCVTLIRPSEHFCCQKEWFLQVGRLFLGHSGSAGNDVMST